MNDPARWTTTLEIQAKVERLWSRGSLLACRLSNDVPLFPWELRLTRPDPRALGADFDAVRQWIRALEDGSKAARGFGYDIRWEEINHRQLGRNRLPSAAVVATEQDAIALLGVQNQVRRFDQLAATTLALFPELRSWLARRPLLALENAAVWTQVVAVLAWLRDHPRPGIYLRQLEVPGVDTKFIESNKGLLGELLDIVLPPTAIHDQAVGARQFELRFGILPKPPLVRFRLLDPAQHLGSLTDMATPATQFARLTLPIRRVFITENETNGLAFPPCTESIVVFGLGYGLQRLAEVAWLRDKAVHYWGDIDTHGFAMLDRLRATLPQARSFLMDRETLMLHELLWSHEPSPHTGALPRLTDPESALYGSLRLDQLGPGVRLEQERIAFAWVRQTLNALPP